MAASNGPHRYRNDIPEAVAQKIHLLQEQGQQIKALEAQLNALRQGHATLEMELVPYLVTVSSAPLQTDPYLPNATFWESLPINSCPDEVLAIIFGLCIAEDHSRIATLLQVCRRWHYLIMNSPILWACLQINQTNYRSFIDPSNDKFDSYKRACMSRNKGQPIAVNLNFSLLPEPERFIEEILDTLPYFNVWREDRYTISSCFHNLLGPVCREWILWLSTGWHLLSDYFGQPRYQSV